MRVPALSYRGRRHLPLPRGPHTVGCTDIITSFSKSGAFIRLFYPAEESDAEEHFLQWPPWMPNKHYIIGSAIRAGVYPTLYEILYPFLIGNVYIPAVWQSQILQTGGPFPVVVFSHGLGGFRNAYSSLCIEIASHGYVVAAVEHRDGSACASFYLKQDRMSACGPNPSSYLQDLDRLLDRNAESEWKDAVDGRWEPKPVPQYLGPSPYTKEYVLFKPVDGENEVPFRKKQLDKRAEECSQALDILESLNIGNFTMNLLDPRFRAEYFQGRLDMRRPAVVGHSFGGATAILSLTTELRFLVGIALDPWMLPFENNTGVFNTVSRPLLIACSDNFQDEKSLGRLQELMSSTRNECEVLKIKEAQHRDQADLPFVSGFVLRRLMKVSGRNSGYRTHCLCCELTMEFINKHLKLSSNHATLNASMRKKYVVDCFEER